jgi:hypothetical protein
MGRYLYSLYLSTYHEAHHALSRPNEKHVRQLCSEVANRSGFESALSLMAMSDAETGRPQRTKTQILAIARREGAVAPH